VRRISHRTFAQQEFQRTSTRNKQGRASNEQLDQMVDKLRSAQAT
jgi:hypothetical protein